MKVTRHTVGVVSFMAGRTRVSKVKYWGRVGCKLISHCASSVMDPEGIRGLVVVVTHLLALNNAIRAC